MHSWLWYAHNYVHTMYTLCCFKRRERAHVVTANRNKINFCFGFPSTKFSLISIRICVGFFRNYARRLTETATTWNDKCLTTKSLTLDTRNVPAVSVESTSDREWKWKSSHVVSECGMLHLICNEINWREMTNNLLIGAECIATSAAVLAWIQLALLHIVGTRSALETFRAMAFEVTTGQRCACAAIVARRWRAQILLFTIFACRCRKKFGFQFKFCVFHCRMMKLPVYPCAHEQT